MKYAYILFDLDGTLTDPALGITNAVIYALRHYGIEVQDRRELYPFIGPPLTDSFEKYFHFTHEQAVEAVELYRVYFRDIGLFQNTVYPGIPALLAALKTAGAKLVLATSKPTVFAQRILEHFKLRPFFHLVCGSELNGERVEKAAVIRFALDKLGVTALDRVIMVGDRSFDIEGAAACGLPAIAVSYGYGNQEELTNATAVADTVEVLQQLLLAE